MRPSISPECIDYDGFDEFGEPIGDILAAFDVLMGESKGEIIIGGWSSVRPPGVCCSARLTTRPAMTARQAPLISRGIHRDSASIDSTLGTIGASGALSTPLSGPVVGRKTSGDPVLPRPEFGSAPCCKRIR
jgi:hypothetical protein